MILPCRPGGALRLLLALSCAAFAGRAQAQKKAVEITVSQNAQSPYLFSGRLMVQHGSQQFFGTATTIRRYTGLTCGHLLYNSETGLSTHLMYSPHLFLRSDGSSTAAASFGILSGYADEVDADGGDSDFAFARDLGYVLFVQPASAKGWADWQADPDALLAAGPRLVLGYAAESFPGTIMASVNTAAPYVRLRDGLYESTDYYTQSGMSGGPVYLFAGGSWQIFAETVAGTSPPGEALSDVRAITAEARTLLIEPEYASGLVTSGFISGASSVATGATATYRCGVVFADGRSEANGLPPRYAELNLKATGPNKRGVAITRIKPGKFRVNFGGLPRGAAVELQLLRDSLPKGAQTPLAQWTVTAN